MIRRKNKREEEMKVIIQPIIGEWLYIIAIEKMDCSIHKSEIEGFIIIIRGGSNMLWYVWNKNERIEIITKNKAISLSLFYLLLLLPLSSLLSLPLLSSWSTSSLSLLLSLLFIIIINMY